MKEADRKPHDSQPTNASKSTLEEFRRRPVDTGGRLSISRRQLILGSAGLATVGILAGRKLQLQSTAGYEPLLRFGDSMSRQVQRALMHERPLAPEYRIDQLTKQHPTNGGFGASYIEPNPAYESLLINGFRDWRLRIEGSVEKPSSFSLEDLRSMPRRTQITMHCCDMGWSAIGQWTGVPLGWILEHVGLRNDGRYLVFYCMDRIVGGQQMFTSIDRLDAFHPQTILAYQMNGETLPKRHGAPLRLRTELQIGYKQSKHIERIVAVNSLAGIGRGFGGLVEDIGYQWYAGM